MTISDSWVALSLVRHIGNKTLTNLLETFGSTDAILKASKKDLTSIRGIGQKIAEAILSIDLDIVRRDLDIWQDAGVRIIPLNSDEYPDMLKTLDDAPLTLFVLGHYQPDLWQPAVAVVGTRHPSPNAKFLTLYLAKQYAEMGWTVVSGLALGIDSAAHLGALQATDTKTIAVLGGGVLNVYPPQNDDLAQNIMQNGALISENSPYSTSSAPRLVTRNRIISGLCQRVIVVQSNADGGAMHAARFAYKQERQLYTVNWQFSGNQALIKQGVQVIDPDNPQNHLV